MNQHTIQVGNVVRNKGLLQPYLLVIEGPNLYLNERVFVVKEILSGAKYVIFEAWVVKVFPNIDTYILDVLTILTKWKEQNAN